MELSNSLYDIFDPDEYAVLRLNFAIVLGLINLICGHVGIGGITGRSQHLHIQVHVYSETFSTHININSVFYYHNDF
jgi:hypothetical protein